MSSSIDALAMSSQSGLLPSVDQVLDIACTKGSPAESIPACAQVARVRELAERRVAQLNGRIQGLESRLHQLQQENRALASCVPPAPAGTHPQATHCPALCITSPQTSSERPETLMRCWRKGVHVVLKAVHPSSAFSHHNGCRVNAGG